MKRLELIEQLEAIQQNIESINRQLDIKMPSYFTTNGWNHVLEIKTKALKYWKRRFNRVVLQLGYYL